MKVHPTNYPKKWTAVSYWMIYTSLGLIICSIIISVNTLLKYAVIWTCALLGGAIATIFLTYLWRKEYFPFWSTLCYGMLSGSALVSFSLLAPNYFYKEKADIKYQADIIKTGNRSKRNSSCKTPYAVITFEEMEKEIVFPCDYEATISQFNKVELVISRGLWGFYIIKEKRLLR